MTSRTPRAKRGGGKKSTGRRTAASGGAPARSRRKPGNPGFLGYEYQIEVTVWVALDLMLAKAVTDVVVIEPRSEEDLEAAVKDPAVASLGLTALGARLDLILQAKTRSGSPWSTMAIADVLLGKEANSAVQGGRRSRPLEMLQGEMQRRYVFVTNEASAESLRPHEGAHLFDFPEVDELPPHARAGYDKAAQASLAPRIVLLTGVTREVLAARIGALLTQHGHVHISKHNDCAHDLREAVRQRIAGAHDGRWTRSDVMEVLVRYGGSLAPTRDMDRYVRPKSFDAIKAQFDKAHAVVIAGPSGTGKTLTADILELDLRNGPPVFDVVGEENGPGFIRHNLTRADPVLFHLRDPWGGNRLTPGADRWSGELPKLLDNAGPGRKFLITSRSDVLHSAGHELMKALQSYVVSIEVEDYGRERLAEIYDGIAADLGDHARRLATQHRGRALKELTRPYEVKRFLVALSREDSQKPRKIEEVLADSQIEAIAKVIADQVAPFGADGVEAAAVIWALLSARGAVAREVFVKLGRRLRSADPNLRPDIDGLIDFLVAGQNLRQDSVALAFYHPRVEDGLRLTFMSLPRDAERTLSITVDVLLAWDRAGEDWGLETGLNVLRASAKVEELELNLSPITTQRLDQHLDAVALSAEKRADFERALSDLEQFGSEDHPPARLARILIDGGPETEAVAFGKSWRAPDPVDEDISTLREDGRTQTMIERFIREVLPFSDRNYHSELIPLLDRLATDLSDAFWDALDAIAGPGGPHNNIDVIVTGALASAAPDYERAIARFARSEAEADAWLEGYAKDLYEAEEHAIDADAADHVIEEPSERYFNAHEGMKMVMRLRRAREGVTWIAGHLHRRSLLNALGDLIAQSHRAPPIAELEFLLAQADDWGRDQAWRAAEQHWDDSLSTALIEALARSDVDSAGQRGRLVEIAARRAGGDPVPDLIAASQHAPFARRLEMVYDLFRVTLDNDPKREEDAAARRARAARLVESFIGAERSVGQTLLDLLACDNVRAVARSLSDEDRSLLTATLASASIDLTGPLACLAAAAGLNVDEAASRLLSTDDAADGKLGIQALLIAGGPNVRTKLEEALGHKRYNVRRRALRVLADDATAQERVRLIATADDHSAEVRLAFAVLMEEYRWPEAVDALVTLLGDTRNFASQLTVGSWSKFSVARAGARALAAYEDLPGSAIDALLDAAQAEGPDPFVACSALSALTNRNDTRVMPAMEWALESAGLNRSLSHRPRAQAAAWALCDRATNGQSDMLTPNVVRLAERDVAAIAGPLLVAIGVHPGATRDALLKRLRASGQHGREQLVRTAALAGDAATGMSLDDPEQTLYRLVRGETLDSLSTIDRVAVEAWSSAISSHMLSFVNRRHIDANKLAAACRDIINSYAGLQLPKFWGDGKSAAADGTKYDLYDQNLLASYHIRYGGYGGIAYHHVSNTYIALFSHFIPCGVWEAVYIIDGLLKNTSDIQPDTVHADTQGQSLPVFGLSHLLGIKLMPRIRNWHDYKFYRADDDETYEHIGALFKETIDWDLIETHWKDLMQVVLSIKSGKIAASTLLRKLGNYSRKNRLYQAFRMLGAAIRTIFLLQYISDRELREIITASTNKVESYNGYAKFFFFGGEGVIADNDPLEQEKAVKYNDLVANAVTFYNVVEQTRIIRELIREGWKITRDDLAVLSPYVTSHIKRFGDYLIDAEIVPEPYEGDLPLAA